MSNGLGSLRVAILGSKGFVGTAVERAFKRHGHTVSKVAAPRLSATLQQLSHVSIESSYRSPAKHLATELTGCDVVVNAAGVARPASTDIPHLLGGNGVLPLVVAIAADSAHVPRVIHVSSAAVQGSRNPLDESECHAPFSPYSLSKSIGERLLTLRQRLLEPEIVIYRPASVVSSMRPMTNTLVGLARFPILPSSSRGDVPLPLVLLENVGQAVVALAEAATPPAIALHPTEGITLARFLDLVGAETRIVSVPPSVSDFVVLVGKWIGRRWCPAGVINRRVQLLLQGQGQNAVALTSLGFQPIVGIEGYIALREELAGGVDRKSSGQFLP